MGLAGKKRVCYDRFVPVRCSMDFDVANYMLTTGNQTQLPKSEYQKLLNDHVFQGKQRILAFNNMTKTTETQPQQRLSVPTKSIPRKGANMVLSIPDLNFDDRTNLLDWGSSNVIAVGLANSIVCRHPTDLSQNTAFTFSDDMYIICLSWSPDGTLIACGNTFGSVYLLDVATASIVDQVWDSHTTPKHGIPLSLSWKTNSVLTVGGIGGKIADHDIRLGSAASAASTYRGHKSEVLELKWSDSRCYLASGGEDKLVHIWDARMANSVSHLHRLSGHTGPVKALDWSPNSSLLASGASWNDNTIKFWNTQSGACLSSFDTGSEVTALMWDVDNKKQLLSSDGRALDNQLSLWNYPSMSKLAIHSGHESRVLTMARSPDGSNVASISKDKTLRVWNVFDQIAPKKKSTQPFCNYALIR